LGKKPHALIKKATWELRTSKDKTRGNEDRTNVGKNLTAKINGGGKNFLSNLKEERRKTIILKSPITEIEK